MLTLAGSDKSRWRDTRYDSLGTRLDVTECFSPYDSTDIVIHCNDLKSFQVKYKCFLDFLQANGKDFYLPQWIKYIWIVMRGENVRKSHSLSKTNYCKRIFQLWEFHYKVIHRIFFNTKTVLFSDLRLRNMETVFTAEKQIFLNNTLSNCHFQKFFQVAVVQFNY